ncbi:MAG TPA: hypothetical protein VGF26_01980, partial [Ramlibacter sp.]
MQEFATAWASPARDDGGGLADVLHGCRGEGQTRSAATPLAESPSRFPVRTCQARVDRRLAELLPCATDRD